MRLLIPTDSFPPICGGSGWSTHALASGLRRRGHDVVIFQPRPGTAHPLREREYDGFRVLELGVTAPNLPYVRNYFKNERLFPQVAAALAGLIARERFDLVHAQHVLTCLPAIDAARQRRVPSVCTVRDYWPVCYWSDLIHTTEGTSLCPACSAGMMTQCVRPRSGLFWPLATPMIPYMRANLARKRRGLAAADAVVAVSSTIAADLRARAPELASTRMDTIPNPVDIARLRASAAAAPPPLDGPYALYLGKLAPNKGTDHLVAVAETAALPWPLVIAGDGPDRASIAAAARRSAQDIRFTGWVDQSATAAWLRHATLLIFPSRGPESLSRVLIDASALGVPIAAMNTGGTADIIVSGETGLLSSTPDELAADVRRLAADPALRERLAAAARLHAERRFDAPAVVGRIEAIYEDLLGGARGA
jgi:glycosyltransferase involved in cell wall biosynthesis